MMHHGRTLKLLSALPPLVAIAMLGAGEVASASATLVFSYPGGFAGAANAISMSGSVAINGSAIQLTPGNAAHQAGGAWYKSPVNIQSFTTNFSFQLPPNGTVPSIQGITFTIQNSNGTTNPDYGGNPLYAGGDANLAGYGVYSGQEIIGNSIAVKFDLNSDSQVNYPAGGRPNSTGLYINGGPEAVLISENDLNPYGINLYSGHPFAGAMVYDGTLLTMTLRDTATNAQARYSWPINIAAVTLSNSAYVGFTGGEVTPTAQNLLSWSFYSGYNPRLAAPTFSVTPGSYSSTQIVSLSAPAGATIYYTTNGLLPTSSSQQYSGPITVNSSEVIQAVAIQTNFTDSLVATGNYQIAPSGSPVINFPSGFGSAANLLKLTGYTAFIGPAVRMTDASTLGTAGAAWYAVPVNVQTFSSNFTLQFTSSTSNGQYGLGTTFCIQNQPANTITSLYGYVSGGPTALANNGTALGYGPVVPGTATGTTGGLLSSVAIKFDLSDNATGLYIDGAMPTKPDVGITGLTLSSGHPLNVTLAYNGTTLTETIKDSVTNASFSHGWIINIPVIVGGNTAYVGFTASSGYFSANQDIESWTYAATTGQATAVPAPPTNLRVQ